MDAYADRQFYMQLCMHASACVGDLGSELRSRLDGEDGCPPEQQMITSQFAMISVSLDQMRNSRCTCVCVCVCVNSSTSIPCTLHVLGTGKQVLRLSESAYVWFC
jgi:hypothetical protein